MAILSEKKKSKKTTVKKASVSLVEVKNKESLIYRTLLRAQATEKSHLALSFNKYIFRVTRTSNKQSVRRAIEALYSVHVTQVRMITIPKRRKLFRGKVGLVSAYKKAIVTVKEGEVIEAVQGA